MKANVCVLVHARFGFKVGVKIGARVRWLVAMVIVSIRGSVIQYESL